MDHKPTRAEILVAAKAAYVGLLPNKRSWAEMAWEDMGGSEPSWERVEFEIALEEALQAAFDLGLSARLAQAWAEGREATGPFAINPYDGAGLENLPPDAASEQ